jgi:putative hydrolase of the HAD superfamily
MTDLKGLILDFGGVLTTPLIPAALAFEQRAGLAEGSLLTALYLNEEMIRHTEELERLLRIPLAAPAGEPGPAAPGRW